MRLFKRNYLPLQVLGLMLLAGVLVLAQKKDNVSSRRHPILAAAQQLCTQAADKITEAQKGNEFDMGGHAQKAKDMLEEVRHELKLAAEAANK